MADEPDIPDGGDIKAALTRKIGPLPMGVWLLAIGGGLIIAYMVRRSTANDDAAPEYETSTDTIPGVGGGPGGANTVTPGVKRATTNEEWYQLALEAILASSVAYSPSFVDLALRKYIGGLALTVNEQAVVALAIRLVGAPPYPVPVPPPGDPDPGGGGDDDEDPPTGNPPDVDPPGQTWDGGDSHAWTGNDSPLWDGVPAPPKGPVGAHGYVVPMNNTPSTVHRWFANGGEALKRAQPYGAGGEFTVSKNDLGKPGNPKPDGPPGYVKGR